MKDEGGRMNESQNNSAVGRMSFQPRTISRMQFILHPSSFILPRRRRAAFTLNELLVVMALLVLVIAIAIPAFSLITTGRSIESAENQISAFLGSTRADAIGLQEPRGALLFVDPANNRVTLAQVYFPAGLRPTLDLFPGKEEMALPGGVGLRGVPNGIPNANIDNWPRYAIVMFDGDGRLLLDFTNIIAGNSLGTRLNAVATSSPDKPPVPLTGQSNIGFVLFDKPRHDEQTSANLQKWFQDNSVPYLVNRYNGTLMKGQ
jgi:type II secretory pathway pseudopilin PulG